MDTWIIKMIKARSVRRVIAWVLVLVCVGLIGSTQVRYIKNFVMGPYDLGPADLATITDVSETPRYFARVTGSKAIDTGLQQITIHKRGGVETSRTVSGAYIALVMGEKLLICKSESGSRTTLEGHLAPIPASLEEQLFNTPQMKAIHDRFFSFYLNDDSFRTPGYWALGGILVFGLLWVWLGRPAWRYMRDPGSHPLAERVKMWGDPMSIAVTAEREAQAPRYKAGHGWAFTDQLLIQSTFFYFDLFRLSDLKWAYKKITKHSVNFIPTGKTYAAVLSFQDGTATVQGKEKVIDEILGFLAQKTPWAVFGHSKEIEEFYTKRTLEFRELVEQRRLDWAKQGGVQRKE